MTTVVQTKYDVGGILLDRPFKIRRLGHFGFNVVNMDEARHFYIDLLGFKVSDVADFGDCRLNDEQKAQIKGDAAATSPATAATTTPSSSSTSRSWTSLSGGTRRPDVTMNQITWQVGSLAEVGDAAKWLTERGEKLQRVGRDMPGSNWHAYVYDPDGHTNELYYGIEQVGWDGFSKPRTMYGRGFREAPALPQINEFQEVQDAMASGIDLESGYRHIDDLPAKFDVQGVLLPRPFKITRIGPVKLFVAIRRASNGDGRRTIVLLSSVSSSARSASATSASGGTPAASARSSRRGRHRAASRARRLGSSVRTSPSKLPSATSTVRR